MVAILGRDWRLAPSLVAMVDEANTIAPNRNRRSDGSIGDRAHASRTSDHNPSGGWVHAVDLTHAPAHGWDAHARARQIVARRDRRIAYVISSGQMARSYAKPGIPAWTWTRYTGSNAHTQHAHVSILHTDAARKDTSPWWPDAPQEDDMPLNDDDKTIIRNIVRQEVGKAVWDHVLTDGRPGVAMKAPAVLVQGEMFMRTRKINSAVVQLAAQQAALAEAVSQLGAGGGSIDYGRIEEAAERASEKAIRDVLGGLDG